MDGRKARMLGLSLLSVDAAPSLNPGHDWGLVAPVSFTPSA